MASDDISTKKHLRFRNSAQQRANDETVRAFMIVEAADKMLPIERAAAAAAHYAARRQQCADEAARVRQDAAQAAAKRSEHLLSWYRDDRKQAAAGPADVS